MRRLFLIVLFTALATGCSYNRLTSQEEAIKGSWSEVENQLQRRNDLHAPPEAQRAPNVDFGRPPGT